MNDATEVKAAMRALEIFSARHPRSSQVTQKQAEEMLGFSEPTVRKLVRSGQLKLNRCGMVPIETVDRLLASENA